MAPSTIRTYQAAWRSYLGFVLQNGLVALPLSTSTLELFVVRVSSRLRFSTIKVYLAALKFISTFYGLDSSIVFTQQLYYLLRGIRRAQAVFLPPRPPRTPISLAHLRALFRHVDLASTFDAPCFRAAFTLAFFGLLRVSEFTCPSSLSFDPSLHLSASDIRFSHSPSLLHVHIKQSKTDPFRQGCTIRVARTGGPFCPFQAMVTFLQVRPSQHGPLFILSNGSFLTRADIQRVLAATFPDSSPGSLGSHSFRIGGASMLCSLGVPDATVQLLGRWSSDAFRRYLRVSDQFLTLLHRRASTNEASFARIWQPQDGNSVPSKRKK